MDPSVMLRLWSSNDPQKLHLLAKDIEAQGSWQAYLSVQEHKIFEHAVEKGGELWAQFLEGAVACFVEHVPPNMNGTTNGNDNSPVNGSANRANRYGSRIDSLGDMNGSSASGTITTNGHSTNGTGVGDDSSSSMSTSPYNVSYSSRISSTPQPGLGSGPTSFLGKSAAAVSGVLNSRASASSSSDQASIPTVTTIDGLTLAFRVRYMLYDKSLSILFPSIGKDIPFDFDSILFEGAPGESGYDNDTSATQVTSATLPLARNVDDDYDIDDDDENEDEEEDKMNIDNDNTQQTINETNNEQDDPHDELGRLIIKGEDNRRAKRASGLGKAEPPKAKERSS